jgi:hypothetical protein
MKHPQLVLHFGRGGQVGIRELQLAPLSHTLWLSRRLTELYGTNRHMPTYSVNTATPRPPAARRIAGRTAIAYCRTE